MIEGDGVSVLSRRSNSAPNFTGTTPGWLNSAQHGFHNYERREMASCFLACILCELSTRTGDGDLRA